MATVLLPVRLTLFLCSLANIGMTRDKTRMAGEVVQRDGAVRNVICPGQTSS